VGKNPYSKPAIEQLRAKYREALSELEFLTAGVSQFEGRLTEDQMRVFEVLAKYLYERPDKFQKFEKFLIDL
jgi:hypothetical protein